MFDNPPPPFNCNPLLVAIMRWREQMARALGRRQAEDVEDHVAAAEGARADG